MSKTASVILAIILTAIIVFGLTFSFMFIQNRVIAKELSYTRAKYAKSENIANEVSEVISTDGENDKLAEVGRLIDQVYIGTVDEAFMTEQLCSAMVKGIDDEWSYYISADQYANYYENVTNSYVGIGITIRLMEEGDPGFTIVEISPDSPAEKAGLKPGDMLIAVEGENAVELGIDESKNRVRGEEGTDVKITFRIDGKDKELTLTRSKVKSINITYEMLDDKIGYIHIRNFEQGCAADTIAAIEDLQSQDVKGIVFDLRFNPGGLKSELVDLLDYLLPEGIIFHSESYNGKEEFDRSDKRHLDLPMSVLVNVDSYSAAEFFAATMQEYEAATIVGTQTYGKGYFQQCFRLSDGSAVNISTGKYYTPDGDSLAGVGITPDHVIEISDEEYLEVYYGNMAHEDDVQLQDAIAAVAGK